MKRLYIILLIIIVSFSSLVGCTEDNIINVGYKNSTEQLILAQMFSKLIKKETSYDTNIVQYPSSELAFEALKDGKVDVYPEYTGIMYGTLLEGDNKSLPANEMLESIVEDAKENHNILVLNHLGYNNPYVLAVQENIATDKNLTTITDLASGSKEMKLAANNEFIDSEDGYKGIQTEYELEFKHVQGSENGLRYISLENGDVDIVQGYITDSYIKTMDLIILEDDKDFFINNYPIPMINSESADNYPEIVTAIKKLEGNLTVEEMLKLTIAVDEDRRSPEEVVEEFLKEKDLID